MTEYIHASFARVRRNNLSWQQPSLVDLCLHPTSQTVMSSQQKLVLSIIEFLSKSIEDGTVKQDDREGLEVASMLCLFSFISFR